MAVTFFKINGKLEKERLNQIIDMISSMAKLDFSMKLSTEISNDPIDVISHGLNMLSEELEFNVVKRAELNEVNSKLEKYSYTVAHDLKAPFHSINGLLSLIEIENEKHLNENITNYINLLKDINFRCTSLINDILEYSKIDFKKLEMKEIDLLSFCNDISKQFLLNNNVSIYIDEKLPKVYHDETVLSQIFTNLISNAIKHNDKELCEIMILFADKDEHYEITVSDNGPGIPNERKESIFNLFENQDSSLENSSGVGLAIVKRIVTETNGKIWVESNLNESSNFIFTIPKK